MNWLAWDPRAYAGAASGALLGALTFAWLASVHGLDWPWIVGPLAGLGCAFAAQKRSELRGLVVVALAVWIGALAQCTCLPAHVGTSVLAELARYHERVDAWLAAQQAFSGAAAGILGAHSVRGGIYLCTRKTRQ